MNKFAVMGSGTIIYGPDQLHGVTSKFVLFANLCSNETTVALALLLEAAKESHDDAVIKAFGNLEKAVVKG